MLLKIKFAESTFFDALFNPAFENGKFNQLKARGVFLLDESTRRPRGCSNYSQAN
jgi:hypothetical protein